MRKSTRVWILVAALLVPSAAAVAAVGSYGGHGYEWVDGPYTWFEADNEAISKGGHLVTIGSAGENTFVNQLTGGNHVWIGFNDLDLEGTFMWVTGEPVTFTNWQGGEPNNADPGEDCALQYGDTATWNDGVCDSVPTRGYVVEFETSPVPTLDPTALAALAGLIGLAGMVVVRRLRT